VGKRDPESLALRAVEISTNTLGGQHPITARAILEILAKDI